VSVACIRLNVIAIRCRSHFAPINQRPTRSARERARASAHGNPDPVSLTRGTYSTQIPGTATFFTRWGEAAALGG
jgi:hypothetical protein